MAIDTLEAAVAEVTALKRELDHRRHDVDKRDAYYRGKHKLAYASPRWQEYHADRYRNFSDNWCGVVADSPSERLRVNGIRLDSSSELSAAERELWDAFERNDFDAQSSQGFLSSIVASRSFVIVWDDGSGDGEPEISWETAAEVIVGYDRERRRKRRSALKCWTDGDIELATLYTPDYVWKFSRPIARQGLSGSGLTVVHDWNPLDRSWSPREVPGEPWPLPNPLGEVPVVEYPNRPILHGEPISDIAGVMAMQDAINLLWAYAFNAADFASFPQRVVMGAEPPKIPILDSNGQKVGEQAVDLKKLAQDRLLWLTSPNAKVGEWSPAELTAYTDIVEVGVGHVAAQTRTPQHYLIGKMANLSAEALKAAETGLVKKVEESQLFSNAPIRETARLMALVRGDAKLADLASRARVVWRDAESRSEAQLVDALAKLKDIGFPFAWIATRYGLSPSEVAEVLAMRADDTEQLLAGDVSAMFAPKPTDPVADPMMSPAGGVA